MRTRSRSRRSMRVASGCVGRSPNEWAIVHSVARAALPSVPSNGASESGHAHPAVAHHATAPRARGWACRRCSAPRARACGHRARCQLCSSDARALGAQDPVVHRRCPSGPATASRVSVWAAFGGTGDTRGRAASASAAVSRRLGASPEAAGLSPGRPRAAMRRTGSSGVRFSHSFPMTAVMGRSTPPVAKMTTLMYASVGQARRGHAIDPRPVQTRSADDRARATSCASPRLDDRHRAKARRPARSSRSGSRHDRPRAWPR